MLSEQVRGVVGVVAGGDAHASGLGVRRRRAEQGDLLRAVEQVIDVEPRGLELDEARRMLEVDVDQERTASRSGKARCQICGEFVDIAGVPVDGRKADGEVAAEPRESLDVGAELLDARFATSGRCRCVPDGFRLPVPCGRSSGNRRQAVLRFHVECRPQRPAEPIHQHEAHESDDQARQEPDNQCHGCGRGRGPRSGGLDGIETADRFFGDA